MGFFKKLFGHGQESDVPAMPWDSHPSIYEHILAHLNADQSGLAEAGQKLPDDERLNTGSSIRWAAGAQDGVLTHHMSGSDREAEVREVIDLMLTYCKTPTAATKAELYQLTVKGNVISLIDPLLTALVQSDSLDANRLYELGYSFTTEAPDREPVKLGLAILGLFKVPTNVEILQTLGTHDEFTLFTAVALSNVSDEPELDLWKLAKKVHGWGRIQLVERLSGTENPQIKDWLLREGYKNSVMYEYLAYTCATTGELLKALSGETIDRQLLTSSGEILRALFTGGPAAGIDDYSDGARATARFLIHLESSTTHTLEDFIHANVIHGYLSDDSADWPERFQRDWTAEDRSVMLASCERILDLSHWPQSARTALQSSDEMTFRQGTQIAERLGIDCWDAHWHRLQAAPQDSFRWFYVMSHCDSARIDDVIEFALANIDLAQIATGPAKELGLGPQWSQHQSLNFILQELGKFPGHGPALVEAGLQSPVVRDRNMAISTLANWGSEQWGDRLQDILEKAAKVEPSEDVQDRMVKLLRGESLDD